MTVTLKKVARRAGVSPSTVSRVLSGHPNVKEETSRKVKEIMEELGYTPNIIAQNLVLRSTNSICVLLPRPAEKLFSYLFSMECMSGIVAQASRLGFDILIASGANEQEELEVVSRLLKGGRADGVIVLSSRKEDAVIQFLKSNSYPYVLFISEWRSERNQVVYSIYVRNHSEEGTFKAVEKDLERIRDLGVDIAAPVILELEQ